MTMVALEATAVVVAGLALATVFVLATAAIVHASLSSSVTPILDVATYSALAGAAALIALLASVVPAWLALRADPMRGARTIE